MREIRIKNGKRMEKIMEVVGKTGATIKKEGEWDLAVYIVRRRKGSLWIEMCEKKTIGGDLFMDPWMKIRLKMNGEGYITEAVPQAYQSDNMLAGRTDINEKGEIFLNLELVETKKGELDRRLDDWLNTIEFLRYFEEPHKVNFH